ncbi:hypothetical protein ONZ51_g1504 [Trametes cubensis]|uniref:F-box domain-containing protein n=1 Tax=Trametes cubensis TaxID=1111947 RepID=A0AAD7U3Y8_9APHY|nr:hypothetical protein ONZ51_g1504 [Trametes cubensis]
MSIRAVNRLSDEILCGIFYALRDLQDVPFYHNEPLQVKWVVVTWVCHRWREVALDNRILWTKLYIWNPACSLDSIRVILDRAPPSAGLEILIYPNVHAMSIAPVDLHASVFKHLAVWSRRIEVLYIPYILRWSKTIDAFVHTLTHLKTVTFTGRPFRRDFSLPWIDLQGLPDLRILRLHQVVFIPRNQNTVSLPPCVTHLEILDASTLDRDDLPNFLLLCADVKNLILDGALPSVLPGFLDDDVWEPIRVPFVAFSHLKFFRMQNETTIESPLIIYNMSLPPSASFELDLEDGGSNPDNGDLPFITRSDAWLRHHVLPEDLGNFPVLASTHTLTVRLVREWKIPILDIKPAHNGVRFGVHGLAGTGESGQRYWSINVSCDDVEHLCSPSLYCDRFFRGFPLIVLPENIVRLNLHIGTLFPVHLSRLWWNLFEDFPAVQALLLGGWALVCGVLGALDKYPYLLPKLQELDLCINMVPHSEQGEVATVILEWLAMRREIDMPLRKVLLQVTREARSDLKAYVHQLASHIRERLSEMEVSEVAQDGSCPTCETPAEEITRDWDIAEIEDGESETDEEWSDYSSVSQTSD